MILGNALLGSRNALLGCAPLSGTPVPPPAPYVSGGGYPITQPPREPKTHQALLNRDYRPKQEPTRINRIDATVSCRPVLVDVFVGVLSARGTITTPPVVVPIVFTQDAVARLRPVVVEVQMGATKRVNAIARAVGRGPMTLDEAFLMGFLAGQEDGDGD